MKLGSITIVSSRSWDDIVSALRHVTLVGDQTLLPYFKAKISTRVVKVTNVYPISLYALHPKLQLQRELNQILLREHRIDTFNQDGSRPNITFAVKGEKGLWNLTPPIVEVSAEDGNIPLLIDGEHRFLLARELGKLVRVVWIENVPKNYPTVSKPVNWQEITFYDKVPPLSKKRHFRYISKLKFPDISEFSSVKITEKNFRYFFYRDLSSVATSGIREQN